MPSTKLLGSRTNYVNGSTNDNGVGYTHPVFFKVTKRANPSCSFPDQANLNAVDASVETVRGQWLNLQMTTGQTMEVSSVVIADAEL